MTSISLSEKFCCQNLITSIKDSVNKKKLFFFLLGILKLLHIQSSGELVHVMHLFNSKILLLTMFCFSAVCLLGIYYKNLAN